MKSDPMSQTPRIVVDPAMFERTKSGGIVGRIHLEAGDFCFPEAGWNDFVVVVLGWWLESMRELLDQRTDRITLRFMEGRFQITVSSANERWALQCGEAGKDRVEFEGCVDGRRLVSEALAAAAQAIEACRHHGWDNADLSRLIALRRELGRLSQPKP